MDDWGRAFSFVDRISCAKPGGSVRGCYTINASVANFPASLVVEAVGQLAAWAAMSEVSFSHRPVAGIAGRIELFSEVGPGQVLDLAVELESVDTEMVGYSGTAHVNGTPVIRLRDCVGPMMPVEDLDEPQALRDRFRLLASAGALPGGFDGLPDLAPVYIGGKQGCTLAATLHVPTAAALYADHFPRRPLFPGTLLMHSNLQVATSLVAQVPSSGNQTWRPQSISDVKLRAFVTPGETLTLAATRSKCSDDSLVVNLESRSSQRLVSAATIQFGHPGQP